MKGLRIVVTVLALIEAGWMTFDGARALAVGDYVTPTSGTHAGELGPWSRVAEAVGIEPRSTVMKGIFVVYGMCWLIIISAFARSSPWATGGMFVAAIGSLWYLPIGTFCSAVQIAALLWMRKKSYQPS